MQAIVNRLEWVVDAFALVLAVVLMGVAIGMFGYALKDLMLLRNFSLEAARAVVLDVLNILVLIELVRMFLKLEKEHSFQIVTLVDAGLVFVTREILVSLYDHNVSQLSYQLVIFGVFALCRMFLSKARG